MALPSDNLCGPAAYAVDPALIPYALRCIDRNVDDLGERVEVAQALGLLPYQGQDRVRGKGTGPRVRGAS